MDKGNVAADSAGLEELLQAVSPVILRALVLELADQAELRRKCVEFLLQRAAFTDEHRRTAEIETVFALWDELEPDLADLDTFGGGPDEDEERVARGLSELAERLGKVEVPRRDRRALLDEVLPYIASRNSGMEDWLYEVAYATCKDDEDWRHLARCLEALGQDWPLEHARRIYRRIGDRERYLELRMRKLEYGADYYDLVTFYWEGGEREKAVQLAREGLQQATGHMTELREFLADRARERGARDEYLELQFAQATDPLHAGSYRKFKELCTPAEWARYEPRILAALAKCHDTVQLEIRMLRGEYDEAVSILAEMRYPRWSAWGNDAIIKAAAALETRYPQELLAFYLSGFGDLEWAASRQEYARQAQVALKLRHMWVDVLKTPEKWREFARKVKSKTRRRPAFQQEFARGVPDWESL